MNLKKQICFIMMFMTLGIYAQAKISGKYLTQYHLFIPEKNSGYFIEQFRYGTARYCLESDLRYDRGLLKSHWGLIDSTGTILTPAVYETCNIREYVTKVMNGTKWGLLSNNGKEIITPKYDFLGDYENGLAAVKLNNKWGYIDTTAEVVIPLEYEYASSIYDSVARIRMIHAIGLLDMTGKTLLQPIYKWIDVEKSYYVLFKDDQYAVMGKNGKMLIDYTPDEIVSLGNDSLVARRKSNGDKYLFNLRTMDYASGGYFRIQRFNGSGHSEIFHVRRNNKEGMIDRNDKVLIPLKYDNIGLFRDGVAPVTLNAKMGFIDTKGNITVPIIYDMVHFYDDGLSIVIKNGIYFVIDRDGKYLFDVTEGTGSFINGYARTKKGGKFGYFNKKGVKVIEEIYDTAFDFKHNVALVSLNGNYFHINEEGKRIE